MKAGWDLWGSEEFPSGTRGRRNDERNHGTKMNQADRYLRELKHKILLHPSVGKEGYSDFIIEGGEVKDTYDVRPWLPQAFSCEYIGNIPGYPLPRKRFLYYCRAQIDVVVRLLQNEEFQKNFIADSWLSLFESDYPYWGYVFDVQAERLNGEHIENWRGKFSELTPGDKIVKAFIPGVFVGDMVPDLDVSPWILEQRIIQVANKEEQNIIPVISCINIEILKYLHHHPKLMYSLKPRQFEELICEILAGFGWQVELTPATRDGGYDIFAISKDVSNTKTSWIIECKKYSPERKIGIDVVRSLCGVKNDLKAANAMIATTSFFTKGVLDCKNSRYDLALKDYNDITDWLKCYK